MGDILSQNEIDALLSALNTGTVDANFLKEEQSKKKVKVYDFRRPNKFSKDQIHTLQVIYENYVRTLTTFLSGQLRAPVQMEVMSVDQLTYEEFIRSIPGTTILNIFSMYPLEGNAILEINPNLGFAFIDRLLGGPGAGPEKVRALTEIEQTVMEKLARRMLSFLSEPWSSIVEIEPEIERIETNPQFTQLASPTEIMIIVSLETKMPGIVGVINICIPFLVLEPIISKLSVHYYYSSSGKSPTPENIANMQAKLESTYLPIRTVLGKAVITIKDLVELSIGDVIPLDKHFQEELEIQIGQRTKFYGKPGLFGSKLAMQITEIAEEEAEYE